MRPDIQNDISLAPFNAFGIAARARHFVRVESIEGLRALRGDPIWLEEPRLILGGGSNVLFTRDFDGLVVHIASKGHRHVGDEDDAHLIEVEAGENWDTFVRASVAQGWPGLENLALIPGSVGAAPVQNIGAYGIELAERFAWLEAFDVDGGETRRMNAADCAFGYRDSIFKHALRGRVIIMRVVFKLSKRWSPLTSYADVRARLIDLAIESPTPQQIVDVVTSIRRAKLPDPAQIGNAGSFFKNPVITREAFDALRAIDADVVAYPEDDGRMKVAAGWLIDRCGWRGRSLEGSSGRAAVHDRQALVLVNRGGATGAEVLALADAVRESVAQRFAITLEAEPAIV
jgi:UDP-N-acetylmuramate dehydrogenase